MQTSPTPCPGGVTDATLLWLATGRPPTPADRVRALPPHMSGALAQESSGQSRRRPEVEQELGEKTVSPTLRALQIKGGAEDRFWFQGWVGAGVPHAQVMECRV